MSKSGETQEDSVLRETLDRIIEDKGERAPSQGCLANTVSPFLLSIKANISDIHKIIDKELTNKKISQINYHTLKELCNKIFLSCMNFDSTHIITEAKLNSVEEYVKTLENQTSDYKTILDGINSKIDIITNTHRDNQSKIEAVIDNLAISNSEGSNTKPKTGSPGDGAPVLVIDTIEGTDARSYRDALMAAAPELDLPKPSDLVIPGANRIILKMNDQDNLTRFKNIIDGDPNLGKLAQVKISRRRKHRLILFGIPDAVSDETFKLEVEALGETMGQQIEIVKNFKNGKIISDTKNYIIDVEAQVANNLLDLKKFVLNFNRIRIQRYYNIIRCFKCQRFGHAAHSCRFNPSCATCGLNHDTRQCTGGPEKCVNCKGNRDKKGNQIYDHNHRADSRSCETLLEYKKHLISQYV
ncbi:hypothetical protein JTE90_005169 [Oedothorax gibbosus]|uniref:CCHC-type domain-containing protein n=1 Tax=Oedothorax gibbosus TaxID=931172 RepID=A0AAV6TRC7_9ARAC|nr:hypothetical protein JTE90_005169 [Oedothorax gibbosus]